MKTYSFKKYHALGNSYLVMNPETNTLPDTESIKIICDVNIGIGSDGILWGPEYNSHGIPMLRIFNPDGSEAEKSGNGIRIFSRFLKDMKIVTDNQFELYTKGGTVKVLFLDTELIKVGMGKATFTSTEIPVNGTEREVVNENLTIGSESFQVTCLSVGNPHCVIPVTQKQLEKVKEMGPLVENNPLFPNRINMQLLYVIDKNNIEIRIWERGAGYTLASGSSSCAAAAAAFKLGLVKEHIHVHMPGGIIDIQVHPDWNIDMTGSVTYIGEGNIIV